MKIKVHIIARLESKRVQRKNLRLLNGKPMIQYAIEAARDAKRIDETYINTENDLLGRLAVKLGIRYYKRPFELAADDVVLDQTTWSFLNHIETDIVGMVNPVCPLTTSEDIDQAIDFYLSSGFDTLIPVREEFLHTFYGGKPLNFDILKKIPMTQDLLPPQIVTWNFCFWRAELFRRSFQEKGSGVFCGKVGLYPIDKMKAVKVSEESDFQIAEALLRARQNPSPIAFYQFKEDWVTPIGNKGEPK